MSPARREPDPAAGPVEAFAYELRRLRERAGSPDYRSMARRAGCAHSTLSTAAAGRKLPTLETTLAFVRACGADTGEQARWARRWKQVRAQLDQAEPAGIIPVPPPAAPAQPPSLPSPADARGDQDVLDLTPPSSRLLPRRRGAAVAAGAAAVAAAGIAVGAVLGFGTRPTHSAAARPAVLRTPTIPPAAGRSPGAPVSTAAAPEPERRHGPLVIVPGTVVDLDSLAPDWGARTSPGTADDDIEFTSDEHALTGLGNADMAILPAGDVGTFHQCALEQNYGVQLPAQAIRPGVLLCDITSNNRVAMLRITDVQRDASGTPDQVTLDVTVWVRLHQN